MELRKVFDFRGLNIWVAGTAIGLNFIVAVVILTLVYFVLSQTQQVHALTQAWILVAFFTSSFLIGWLCGVVAADGRGMNYGVLGTLGAVIPIAVVVLPTGVFGLILAITAFFGGLNGGLFSNRRFRR
jgi:hypothetical protein